MSLCNATALRELADAQGPAAKAACHKLMDAAAKDDGSSIALECPCLKLIGAKVAETNYQCYFNAKDQQSGKSLISTWRQCNAGTLVSEVLHAHNARDVAGVSSCPVP